MNRSDKLLKILSSFVENGILTSTPVCSMETPKRTTMSPKFPTLLGFISSTNSLKPLPLIPFMHVDAGILPGLIL